MRRVSLRPGRVLYFVAVVVWLSSFALPTISFGGRGVAPGIGAFLLSFYVGPVAFVIVSTRGLAPQDLAAAAFYTVYFLWLELQNLLVPVALAIRPPRRRSVAAAAAGLAAASVALVPSPTSFASSSSPKAGACASRSGILSGPCRSGSSRSPASSNAGSGSREPLTTFGCREGRDQEVLRWVACSATHSARSSR